MKEEKIFNSMTEFYPFYLSQHSNGINRKLHFIGTSLSIINFFMFIYFYNFIFLFTATLSGYGFAWIGHFFFEKNKPATFNYPIYSLIGDFMMYFSIIVGTINEDLNKFKIKTS